MPRNWVQPRLDGGALSHFHITADFRWPVGWRASLWIRQEGDEAPQPYCVTTASELTSQELDQWIISQLRLMAVLD